MALANNMVPVLKTLTVLENRLFQGGVTTAQEVERTTNAVTSKGLGDTPAQGTS